MISLRRLFYAITVIGVFSAVISSVYRRNQLLRECVTEMKNVGVRVTFTSPEGTVLYVEAPGEIRVFSAEELDSERWMFRYALSASICREVLRSDTFAKLPTSLLDIEIYECQIDGVPKIPHTIGTCIVEEHEQVGDVFMVLDALRGTNVRYLRRKGRFAPNGAIHRLKRDRGRRVSTVG